MELHQILSIDNEKVDLSYESKLKDRSFSDLLKHNYKKDIILERTTVGPHKDDLDFKIIGYPLKKFGSQGQQKTFLLALKMAHFRLIREVKQTEPILLLDDISERLDEERLKVLFSLLCQTGQVFITAASNERVQRMTEGLANEKRFFMIENGSVIDRFE